MSTPPPIIRYCPSCHKALPNGAAFCPACGSSATPKANSPSMVVMAIRVFGALLIFLILVAIWHSSTTPTPSGTPWPAARVPQTPIPVRETPIPATPTPPPLAQMPAPQMQRQQPQVDQELLARVNAVGNIVANAGGQMTVNGGTVRITVPGGRIDEYSAQRLAKTVGDRIGGGLGVRVYDDAGIERAHYNVLW